MNRLQRAIYKLAQTQVDLQRKSEALRPVTPDDRQREKDLQDAVVSELNAVLVETRSRISQTRKGSVTT